MPAPDTDPGFTGVTTKNQFFHTFPASLGKVITLLHLARFGSQIDAVEDFADSLGG